MHIGRRRRRQSRRRSYQSAARHSAAANQPVEAEVFIGIMAEVLKKIHTEAEGANTALKNQAEAEGANALKHQADADMVGGSSEAAAKTPLTQ